MHYMPVEDPGTSTGWLFFSHAFLSRYSQREILNKNPQLWTDTK